MTHMRTGLALLVFAMLAALGGCPNTSGEGLIVNVQTDYVPVVEFDAVRVQLDDGAPRDVPVSTTDRFSRPTFVTLFGDAPAGEREVVVTLMQGGMPRATRKVELTFRGGYLVTVVLTRSCAGLACGLSESCLGGRCVPSTCITGEERTCPIPACTSDAMCPSSAPCVAATCVTGACFQTPIDARCSASELCLPETGCVPRPLDPDAGVRADVGVPDAATPTCADGCDDGVACTVDTCASGVCQNTPSDALCTDSVCAPEDGAADPASGCLPPCNATTCASSGCETASCVAGRCMRTSACAGSELCCSGVCALDCSAVTCAGRSAGTVCRPAAGACDAVEVCDGTSPFCPADGFLGMSSVCRASRGECDIEERCTTGTAACPSDVARSAGTACSAGSCDGLGDCSSGCTPGAPCSTGNVCEVGEFRCGPTRCEAVRAAPATTVCRAAAGPCDQAERCGGSTTCPADTFLSGVECRGQAGVCDAPEMCSGSSAACPINQRRPNGTVCRASGGACDVAEVCNGVADGCPADAFSTGGVCRPAAGACDAVESCTGGSPHCPADAYASGGVCRSAVGACDVAESCTGGSPSCPADAFASGGVCRPAGGPCGVAESCTGASPICPVDTFQPASTLCRGSRGPCDDAEFCSGSSDACPADVFSPDGTECNVSCGYETCAAGNCVGGFECSGFRRFCECDTRCIEFETLPCVSR